MKEINLSFNRDEICGIWQCTECKLENIVKIFKKELEGLSRYQVACEDCGHKTWISPSRG